MVEFDVRTNVGAHMLDGACRTAEKILAVQVLKDTRPYVPFLSGSLNQRSHVEGNTIVYPGPYARYLYYGKAMVDENGRPAFRTKDGFRFHKGAVLHATDKDLVYTHDFHPQAQAYWFEASKAANLDKWMRVARKAVSNGK